MVLWAKKHQCLSVSNDSFFHKEARMVKDVKWLAAKYFWSIWTQLPVNFPLKLIHKTVSSIHLTANIKILIINGYHIMAVWNSQEESKKPAT